MEFTELLQRTADVARGAGGLVLAIKKPEVYEEIRRLSSGGRSAGDGLNQ